MHSQINLNEMMSLTKNFKTVNKISYVSRSFEQERQNNNTTTVSTINSKIEKNLNIMIKKFKYYNYDQTNHKAFVYSNKYVFNQNSSN